MYLRLNTKPNKEKLIKNMLKQMLQKYPKQMFQRLPIALAQVKAGNMSKNLLNEIRQSIYSLFLEKEITKKVDNNIINSTKL